MEKKVVVVLLSLSELVGDKFVILEKDEIFQSCKGSELQLTDIDEVISFIEKDKLITIKYRDDYEYCLAITESGLVTISDIKKKIEDKKHAEELLLKQEAAKLSFRKSSKKVSLSKDALAADEDRYFPDSINDNSGSENIEYILNDNKVITKQYNKIKVFFIGLFGGSLGGGVAATIVCVIDAFLIG